jgi:hypothetical protein
MRVMSLAVVFVEGVADALVGGAGLAVDAVGVDLEQDGDAVASAAGDFGGGVYRLKTNRTASDLGFMRSATPPGSTR